MAPVRIGLLYDDIFLAHDTRGHAENASRLTTVTDYLRTSGLASCLVPVKPVPATPEELSLVHSAQYVNLLRSIAAAGGGWLDGDTVLSARSFDVACYAAGGTRLTAQAVMKGELDRAFALVRPPGHHAERSEGMGFCLLNNVAFAAASLLSSRLADRILIVDFDVHHGNGIQHMFYANDQVLYFSVHQSPLYPGTGLIHELGAGAGQGYTVNVPLPPWCGDKEYRQVFEEVLGPAARRYQPDLLLVSAGYDPHWADPFSLMQMTTRGLGDLVSFLSHLADELCKGRLVLALEGGYHGPSLAHGVVASLEVMLGREPHDDPLGPPPPNAPYQPEVDEIIHTVKSMHGL